MKVANGLWSKIDWKGDMNNKTRTRLPLNELKLHFEHVYTIDDILESSKIEQLSTNVYIPSLVEPIEGREIVDALKDAKKSGYDISLPVFQKLITMLLPLIILLFNFIFYICYPLKSACSLLFTIPQKGNLKLPSNFRGIQMLPTLGVLYDRVLSRRLDRWIGVHDEQTGSLHSSHCNRTCKEDKNYNFSLFTAGEVNKMWNWLYNAD